ncbi:unnamed protein product [Orchesella dallaii]|uniref:Uncharacterized protein n=1 Tax=Orchesella dallaii TaxID=48710 RepID=A0ABP1RIW5_9HEXA
MSNGLQGRRATDGRIQQPEADETHIAWIPVTSPNSSQHAFRTQAQGYSQLYICRHSGQLNGQSRTLIIPFTRGMPIPTNNGNLTDCEILIDPHAKVEWTELTEPFDPLSNSYNPVNASRSMNETGVYIGKVTDQNGCHRGLGTIFNESGVFKLLCGIELHMLNSVPVNGFSYHVLCQKRD